MTGPYRTQRITAADLAAGRIRIPIGEKSPFPSSPQKVTITLRGANLVVPYNPRLGPDRERSGVLSIGPALRDLVEAEDVLEVSQDGDRIVLI
jgi:hypothetical protein